MGLLSRKYLLFCLLLFGIRVPVCVLHLWHPDHLCCVCSSQNCLKGFVDKRTVEDPEGTKPVLTPAVVENFQQW